MQTTDELNLAAAEAAHNAEELKDKTVTIGKYVVRRLKRRDATRIEAAIAPLFSVRKDADPAVLFGIMNTPEFEDTLIASMLNVPIEELDEIDYEDYDAIVSAFNEINPNFTSDVTLRLASVAAMGHAITHSNAA